jgi:signal transduction histidine kinase
VIVNLVNNALAYGSPCRPVDVHVEGDEVWAALRVHNDGEPIPADLLAPPSRYG